jgi:hypothetical protein
MNPLSGLRTDKLVHLNNRFVDRGDSLLMIGDPLGIAGGIAAVRGLEVRDVGAQRVDFGSLRGKLVLRRRKLWTKPGKL